VSDRDIIGVAKSLSFLNRCFRQKTTRAAVSSWMQNKQTYELNQNVTQFLRHTFLIEPTVAAKNTDLSLLYSFVYGIAVTIVTYKKKFIFSGSAAQRGLWLPRNKGFSDHTKQRATVGRTPIDE
jgi:hypothetical protein